ncbi:MAG: hypothetical protein EA417_18380 [Gammaproteobacteria bacterium]|nr:MAG: hypothetical protein EA417_18380 [Gammaproteobacteria bacterium]
MDAAAGSVEELDRIAAQIRTRWPKTRIVVRGDGILPRLDHALVRR